MSDKENMVTLGDFLKRTGLNEDDLKHTKIIRYLLDDPEVKKVYEEGFIEEYFSLQNKKNFNGCKYLFCFIGESKNTARLLGSYEIGMKIPASGKRKKMPKDYPFPKHFEDERSYYNSWSSDLFYDFDQRLVVKWTSKKSQLWANSQTVSNMPIITTRTPISSLLLKKIGVTYKELKEIFQKDDLDWKSALSRINAVYFVYSGYGKYIGSSYGEGGLWECWKNHVREKDKFAGVKLINKKIYTTFYYSILKILPLDVSRKQALSYQEIFQESSCIPDFYVKNTKTEK